MRLRTATIHGQTMLLDPDDSLNLEQWGIYEPFETQLIQEHLKPNDVALDIGAHIGYYMCMMAQRAKHVYAFEPNPLNHSYLRINTSGFQNVTVVNVGLGDKVDTRTLYLSMVNSGDDTLYPESLEGRLTIKVRMDALDYMDFHLYPTFVKMDIQGGELLALRGMEQLIDDQEAMTMAIEYYPAGLVCSGVQPDELLGWLRGHEFSIQEIDENSKSLRSIDGLAERTNPQQGGYTNLWCQR